LCLKVTLTNREVLEFQAIAIQRVSVNEDSPFLNRSMQPSFQQCNSNLLQLWDS